MNNDDVLKQLREQGDEDFEDLEQDIDEDLDKALKEDAITPDNIDDFSDGNPHPLNLAGDINEREKQETPS